MRDPTKDLSPVAQEAAVRSLAERHQDAPSLVILSDLDLSGRLGREKRPGYNALLTAIEQGTCTALYSYSLSRLGRSVAELARLVGDCVKRGIPVRLVVDALDTTTASGMLLFHVLASVAEFESEVGSERVKAANAAKRARGEHLGPPRYGESAGENIQLVLDAFHEARSYSGAARLLNQAGVKPRLSKRAWWPSSVAVVIQEREPHATTSRGVRAGGHSDFLLARLLRCPTCKTMLTGTRDRGGRRVRYSCRLGSVIPHPRSSVTESLILPAIQAEVARAAVAIISFTPADDTAAQRRDVEARLDRYRTMFGEGDITRDRFLAERTRAEKDLAALPEADVVLARDPRIMPLVDLGAEPAEANRQLRAVFRAIVLDPVTFQPLFGEWINPAWRSTDT